MEELYGPLFGRAFRELSEAGLDPVNPFSGAQPHRLPHPIPAKTKKKAVPRGTRPKFGEETKYFMFSWLIWSITFILLKIT